MTEHVVGPLGEPGSVLFEEVRLSGDVSFGGVEGRLYVNGLPSAGTIVLAAKGARELVGVAAEDGSFSVAGEAGEYAVSVLIPGLRLCQMEIAPKTVAVAVDNESRHNIFVRHGISIIAGRVVAPGTLLGIGILGYAEENKFSVGPASVDKAGRFQLEVPDCLDSFTITAFRATSFSSVHNVKRGEEGVEIVLEESASLQVALLDVVGVESRGYVRRCTESLWTEIGLAVPNELQAGCWDLLVASEGYVAERRRLNIRPGQGVEVELRPSLGSELLLKGLPEDLGDLGWYLARKDAIEPKASVQDLWPTYIRRERLLKGGAGGQCRFSGLEEGEYLFINEQLNRTSNSFAVVDGGVQGFVQVTESVGLRVILEDSP